MGLEELLQRGEHLIEGTLRLRYFNWYYRRFEYLGMILQCIILGLFDLGIVLHLINNILTRPFVYAENGPDFSGLLSSASAVYLMYAHFKQKEEARLLIDSFGDFRMVEKPQTYDLVNRNMCFLGIFYIFGVYLIGFLAYVLLLISTFHCHEQSDDGCGLIMPVVIPILDLKTITGRAIELTIQIVAGFGSACDVILITWIYNTLCELLGAYIHHLMYMLAQIKEIKCPIGRRLQFRQCVIYHQRIINLASVFFPMFSNLLVIHVINSPIVMSMIAYQLLDGFDIVFATHLSSWFITTLVGCIVGQRIVNVSEELIEAIYMSMPWGVDNQLGKEMSFMLLRSQKVFKLIGGSLISIDHILFVAIIKTAYSYLTLFNDMK